jgi:hypothetical protein
MRHSLQVLLKTSQNTETDIIQMYHRLPVLWDASQTTVTVQVDTVITRESYFWNGSQATGSVKWP